MVLALTVCGIVVALVVVGLFVFGLRHAADPAFRRNVRLQPALGRPREG